MATIVPNTQEVTLLLFNHTSDGDEIYAIRAPVIAWRCGVDEHEGASPITPSGKPEWDAWCLEYSSGGVPYAWEMPLDFHSESYADMLEYAKVVLRREA